MEKKNLLYEGKAKRIYTTEDPDLLIAEYKDDATAFNGQKKGVIVNKGILNNKISAFFFTLLAQAGVESHFVKLLSDREMLVKRAEIIKVELVVRNIAAGSLSKRLGLAEGVVLPRPVVEFYYKDDALGDPLVNEDHIALLELATAEQIKFMAAQALKINELLTAHLKTCNVILVDYKLEFGLHNGQVLLADEISPDTCRFWDATTKEKLDKDRFRRDLGGVEAAYQEIYQRLTGGEK
ncbi:MAG: phosphoribosylaminoimidazolesuccinocarboxamide synthase [Firmicutes bacterium]|nr:phosphoribosylaminoimidazolesuccinocarboxamide synthase [Bacillota bacterium]